MRSFTGQGEDKESAARSRCLWQVKYWTCKWGKALTWEHIAAKSSWSLSSRPASWMSIRLSARIAMLLLCALRETSVTSQLPRWKSWLDLMGKIRPQGSKSSLTSARSPIHSWRRSLTLQTRHDVTKNARKAGPLRTGLKLQLWVNG